MNETAKKLIKGSCHAHRAEEHGFYGVRWVEIIHSKDKKGKESRKRDMSLFRGYIEVKTIRAQLLGDSRASNVRKLEKQEEKKTGR